VDASGDRQVLHIPMGRVRPVLHGKRSSAYLQEYDCSCFGYKLKTEFMGSQQFIDRSKQLSTIYSKQAGTKKES
jgi:hypothetical protein